MKNKDFMKECDDPKPASEMPNSRDIKTHVVHMLEYLKKANIVKMRKHSSSEDFLKHMKNTYPQLHALSRALFEMIVREGDNFDMKKFEFFMQQYDRVKNRENYVDVSTKVGARLAADFIPKDVLDKELKKKRKK
jgi:hypothetical protein